MSFVSKIPPHRHDVSLAGVSVLPLLQGLDGVAVIPDRWTLRSSDRAISVRPCSRTKRLRIRFEASAVIYEGRPGTEDILEATEFGAALRDAIEARLQATGFDAVRLAYRHLREARVSSATLRSDARLMLGLASTLAQSAPRAVADATKIPGVRPAWSVRPAHMAILRALS